MADQQITLVPNTSGTAPPKLKAPAKACDSHHHIYDPARVAAARTAGAAQQHGRGLPLTAKMHRHYA